MYVCMHIDVCCVHYDTFGLACSTAFDTVGRAHVVLLTLG